MTEAVITFFSGNMLVMVALAIAVNHLYACVARIKCAHEDLMRRLELALDRTQQLAGRVAGDVDRMKTGERVARAQTTTNVELPRARVVQRTKR